MLGDQIKAIRLSHNLTQVQLAQKLGVSKQTISNWENNNIYPSIDILMRFATQFGCSADYLLELNTNRIFVDVSGLTPMQQAHLQDIANDFKEMNALLTRYKTEES